MPTIGTAQTQAVGIDDLVKYEGPFKYSREKLTIGNSQTIVLGDCVEYDAGSSGHIAVASGTEGDVVGIALEAATTGAAETADIWCLVRHAIVDADRIDVVGLTKATLVTALKGLGIIARDESDTISEGT